MARPRKCRRVCGMPRTNSFAPMGSQLCEERIIMAVDEYETIRLIDFAGGMCRADGHCQNHGAGHL